MMKRLLWLVLFFSGMAYAQGVRYDSVALNPRGAPIPNATITLCTGTATGTPCSPAALGYTDITTGVSCASGFPVVQQIGGGCTSTTDGNGNFGFWLIPGTYKYSISGPSVATPQTYTITVPVGATTAGSATITGALTVGGLIQCKNLEQVRCVDGANSAGWAGADAGAWIASAANDLPATGGTVDARALQGTITFSSDWMSTIAKPCTILLGNVALSGAANQGLNLSQSNVTIVGIGNGSTGSVIKANGTIAGNTFIHVTGANVTFRNFRVDTSGHTCAANINGVFADTTATNFILDGVYLFGNGTSDTFNCGAVNLQGNLYTVRNGSVFDSISGISLAVGVNTTDGQILDNIFTNYRGGILTQNGTNNTTISRNTFQSVAGSGIVVGLDAMTLAGSATLSVADNVIKAAREHCIYVASNAANLPGNSQVNISGNSCSGFPGVGIQIHESFQPNFLEQQVNATGNQILCGSQTVGAAATSEGFIIDDSNTVNFSDNTERYCQIGGEVTGLINALIFENNTIEYNNAGGVRFRDTKGALKNATIAHNHINNNNLTLGGFAGFEFRPDNGGIGGGTNVNQNILVEGNEANDYQTSFPAQSTTAGGASVTSNVATLTMVNNPIGTGFFVNAQAVVSGFTGADTIYNGTFAVTAVTATSISYALVHANASSTTTGSVTLAATQGIGFTTLSPSNGSAVNTLRFLDNQGAGNTSNIYSFNTGYTNSFLRHNGTGNPNSNIAGWVGSEYNRTDGPPWKYVKNAGDGTTTGWIALAPTNKAMASGSGAITTNVQGQPGGMTAFTWSVDAGATYNFTCELFYQISSVTGVPSPAMAVGGTATYTSLWAAADGYQTAALTTAGSVVTAAASASTLVTTASTPTTTNLPFRFRGEFVVNAAGTFLVTMANSLNAGASVTIGSGGSCSLYQVQ